MNELFKALEKLPETFQSKMLEMLVDEYISGLKYGEIKAFQLAIELKAMEKFVSEAKAKLNDLVLTELDEENNRENLGFKVYKTTAPTRYSFDHYDGWNRLDSEEKAIAKEKKEIESKMKIAFKKNFAIINEDSGEVFPPAKYKSGGQDTFAVK